MGYNISTPSTSTITSTEDSPGPSSSTSKQIPLTNQKMTSTYPRGTGNVYSFLVVSLFSLNIAKISPTVNDVFARLNNIEHYVYYKCTHMCI